PRRRRVAVSVDASSPASTAAWSTSWHSTAMIPRSFGARGTTTRTRDVTPRATGAAPRVPCGGDVLHRLGRPVRPGGAGRLGGSRGRRPAARHHPAHLQCAGGAAHRRAGVDAPRRGRLFSVGEARLLAFP